MANVKSEAQMSKMFLEFDIHLAFACLPQAGILVFGISSSVVFIITLQMMLAASSLRSAALLWCR
jgi:hypothetical protein